MRRGAGWERAREPLARIEHQRDAVRAARAELEQLERAELEPLPRGPNLPPHKRRNPLRVSEADLDPLIPDGWGRQYIADGGRAEDADRLAARVGLPVHALPVLVLLEWIWLAHGAALSGADVAPAAELSAAWLARKVGCHVRWMKELLNRLDPYAAHRRARGLWKLEKARAARMGKPTPPPPAAPTHAGTVYVRRFRQLRLYRALSGRDRWMDSTGKLRRWVDLTGALYPTSECVRALRRRARRDPQCTARYQSAMRADLRRRLQPLEFTMKRRCRSARRQSSTPKSHVSAVHIGISGASAWERAVDHGPDPPAGAVCPSGTASTAPPAPQEAHSRATEPPGARPIRGEPLTLAGALRAAEAQLRALGVKIPGDR